MTTQPKGGGFLIEETSAIYTPENFTAEHLTIARTTSDFFKNEIEPQLEGILQHASGVAVGLLRKSAEIGLTSVQIPEAYGGMEMDLVSSMIVFEYLCRDGSYGGWHGAHSGIGTLPLLLFGTEDQKQRYLPKLASAEMIAAYCLSEPQAGSDAMNIRTRADLGADGTHYVLTGQKMWITNGGAADLYTVFAKVGGEHFTAFLVERAWPGVSPGMEEKKMGIKGSSTTAVYFDNVKVPVGNVLGEVGRGHKIAFNILNLGRLTLGAGAVGGAKHVLAAALKYAKQRHSFGKPIGEFGMIRQKLAEMAIRTFAAETMVYRVGGLIQNHGPDLLAAAEEFSAECAYVKVFASEALDYVVDEAVQIHGGYGYHQDYMVERAYRDARINRIFEGTNEINRMLATGTLLKRAQRGQLGLVAAVKALETSLLSGLPAPDPVANAKKIALLALGIAYKKYLGAIEEQQEILAAITDIAMNTFAIEGVMLRAKSQQGREMAAVFAQSAMEVIESAARGVFAACAEGDELRANLAVLRRFTKLEWIDAFAARRRIAGALLDAERYVV